MGRSLPRNDAGEGSDCGGSFCSDLFEIDFLSPSSYNSSYLTSDNYDRHIYSIREKTASDDQKRKTYVIIINPDGSYDLDTGVMEIKDIYHYQDDLKALKEQNNWDQPYK